MKICTHCGAGMLEPTKPWIHRGKIVCRRCFETLSTTPLPTIPVQPAPTGNPYAVSAVSGQQNSASPMSAAADSPVAWRPQTAPPLNGYGLAGLIIAVMGLFCAGLVSPIGLVMSLVGLKTRPRGMAIIATVLSAVGTSYLIFWVTRQVMVWRDLHHGR